MKSTLIAASAALLGSAAAMQHRAHPAFHQRHYTEDVCTVYTTVYVHASQLPSVVANSTVYVVPSPLSTPCKESSSAPVYIPKVTSTKVYTPPAYTPVAASSTVEAYVAAYTPKSSKAAAKPSASKHTSVGSYSTGGRIVTKGNKWAMTYTPYSSGGDCKSASEVKSDIAKIAAMGFTTIRSYSTDCGVFENVVPACAEHGLKVIFGIFLTGGGAGGKGPFSPYADEQLQTIIKNAPKDIIAMMIVGNEFLFNGYGTPEDLAAYIDHVRTTMIAAGFPSDIAFTTTDTVAAWEQHGAALCSHIDVFAVQIHPYFTTSVSAPDAGKFVAQQLKQAAAICPEAAAKGEYITETGWPHSGDVNGNAVPGYSQQKEAISSILAEVGTQACIFSFQDDLWKAPGALNVEQSFGCAGAL